MTTRIEWNQIEKEWMELKGIGRRLLEVYKIIEGRPA